MKKFTLLCLASWAFAPLAFAGSQNAPAYSHESPAHHMDKARPFTGLQVMMGMGGMMGGLEMSQQISGDAALGLHVDAGETIDINASFSNTISDDASLFQSNIAGQLSLGYAHQFANGVVLGAFAAFGATDIEFESTIADVGEFAISEEINGSGSPPTSFKLGMSGQVRTNYDYDIALLMKPGYLIGKRTWLYGMLGPRWGHFHTSYQVSVVPHLAALPPLDFPSLDSMASGHTSQYALGFTAGVGFAQLLSKHVIFGLEYAYTAYGEFEALNVSNTNVLACNDFCDKTTANGSATIEPNMNTVMATLSYRF